MLEYLREEFILDANKIGDWKKMSKLAIAKGYIANENNKKVRDSHFSAFALRFWHEIPTLYKECAFLVNKLHLTPEDIADVYFDAIRDVFKYRAFMNENIFKYVKDGNEDKFINGYVYRAIDSARQRLFQYYNKGKRRAVLNSYSLDAMVDENGDCVLADNSNGKHKEIDELIKHLIQDDEIYEALLVYSLVYCDVYTKEYNNGVGKLVCKDKKVIKNIMNLTDDDIEYFIEKYGDGKDITLNVYQYKYLSKNWHSLLYKNAIEKLRKNEEVKAICF